MRAEAESSARGGRLPTMPRMHNIQHMCCILCSSDGIEPQSLVTFRNLDSLNHRRLKQILRRYPEKVQDAIFRIPHFDFRV